ncbi:GNAT family N-acetyltransferase [Chitinimonas sp. BJB300]|uniref:GNAT family N-acetyltransferase n=1 Tax=Chitinimonas sp. BJB300 TaxID=1559339 RepID=UPI000C0F126A|nr:GNAT family N-acetyltransferase [Chitinimonas sp. BJB300]PHV12403.1 GNAT family N-acetyltransferase [Chitinimonas sp. BJB300]TSJ88999.1 GNAT family N-acetyltransferase [Chitinimonas sp. BJB300]
MENNVIIRSVEPTDAQNLLALFQRLDSETNFMLLEPEERNLNLESQTRLLEQFLRAERNIYLVAESDQVIVGFMVGTCGGVQRNRHAMSLVVGVMRERWGQGIGRRLMAECERIALARDIHRFELTVMHENLAALQLYLKAGFMVEGLKRRSIKVGDAWRDEYLMSKLLS